MKTFNLKALFALAGCVVEKILVETVGVQVCMRRDRRTKPYCPGFGVALKEVREAEVAVYDLPLAEKAVVWVRLPIV